MAVIDIYNKLAVYKVTNNVAQILWLNGQVFYVDQVKFGKSNNLYFTEFTGNCLYRLDLVTGYYNIINFGTSNVKETIVDFDVDNEVVFLTLPNSQTGNNGSLVYTAYDLNLTTSTFLTNINFTGQPDSLKYNSATKSLIINRRNSVQVWNMTSITLIKEIQKKGSTDTIMTSIICNNLMIVVEGLKISLYEFGTWDSLGVFGFASANYNSGLSKCHAN